MRRVLECQREGRKGEKRDKTELEHLKHAGGEVNEIEANEMLLKYLRVFKRPGENADGQRLTECILSLGTHLN